LRKLAAFLLDARLSKAQQTSNWENHPLTTAQQLYAATDAWVALKIYDEMKGFE
jgi:ribonuclease D